HQARRAPPGGRQGMRAGQGGGPYGDQPGGGQGDPAGQGGQPQGWNAPPPYPQGAQPPYPPGSHPYGQPYPGYGPAPSAPTGYGAQQPLERPGTVRAGIGAFIANLILGVIVS